MMYRATHIYILMSALINLMTANCLSQEENRQYRWLRVTASALIVVAPVFFLAGFFHEPPAYLINRPFSFWGVTALLAGVLLLSTLNLRLFKKDS